MNRAQRTWCSAVTDAFPDADIEVRDGTSTPWSYRSVRTGELSLHEVSAGPQEVRHPRLARLGNVVSLMVQHEGCCRIRSGRFQHELQPGEVMFVDVDQPLELTAEDAYRQSFVLIPKDRLHGLAPRVLERVAEAWSPANRLLATHVEHLGATIGNLDPSEHGRAADALLAHVLCSAPIPPRTSGVRRVRRALDYIDRHLSDPELSPERVASAQGVSRRHLDALLHETGATLTQAIWWLRLRKAAALLRDPGRQGATTLALALECGFKSPAHFSRSFVAHYGVTPTRWREAS